MSPARPQVAYLIAFALPFASPARAAEPGRLVVFNDDAQVLSEASEKGTSAFVRDWLDRESEAVPFTTLVFLAATPDVCTFDSKAGEVYGARFGPTYDKNWAPAIRGLRAEGTDVLHVVTEHMHKKAKKVLAAIRMSDTHHRSLDPNNPLCPQFAIEHPEYVVKQPDGRTNETALDYSYSEVRQHRMAIMREIAEEYNVDGLELNFVRWAKHFPRDKGREKAPIMTKYVREVRHMLDKATKRRGWDAEESSELPRRENRRFANARPPSHRLTLGVRVPESLHACWLAGVDIETWVKNGWIDYVVISTWNNTDPQLPVEEFARFTKPAGVDTIVVMGNMIGAIWPGAPKILGRSVAMSAKHADGYVGMLLTAAEARGAAANYYARGADSISFWNVGIHFGRAKTAAPEQRERIARWTQAVQDIESVYAGPRTYRYLPMGKGISSRKPPARNYPWYDEGRSPLGQPNSPVLEFNVDAIGKRLAFPFRMADGRNGERLAGCLRFWVYRLGANDELQVDLNGKPVDLEMVRKLPAGEFRGGLPGTRFEVDLADCPPFAGDNQLGLTLKTTAESKQMPYMEELEITVQ